MAEKAAWDFFRSQKGDHSIELVVINPGGITGPSLTLNLDGTSMGMVAQMFSGKMSRIPDLSFPMIDVRDVAKLHVQALTKKDINGKRFVAARRQTTHFLEIASILKENGYKKASTKKAPLFLLKLLGFFDPEVKALLTSVGKHPTVDISDTEATFDWDPIPLKKSVLDTTWSVEQALPPDNWHSRLRCIVRPYYPYFTNAQNHLLSLTGFGVTDGILGRVFYAWIFSDFFFGNRQEDTSHGWR